MLDHLNKNFAAKLSSREFSADEDILALSRSLDLTPACGALLKLRGLGDTDSARRFIEKRDEMLYDPFLMKDMREGAEAILRAVKTHSRTVIYGDYDVDGVTSVCILFSYLSSIGADVGYFIPDRLKDGYGVASDALKKLADEGWKTVITVDTGITAVDEALLARELGMEMIVTDHHECRPILPDCTAVIDPRRPDCSYPFKDLAGVGVVFKLLCAMESLRFPHDSLSDCVKRIAMRYCDLAAIGTVADVMPVRDENRLIVSLGLQMMSTSPRPAVEELLNAVSADSPKKKEKRKITSGIVGFTLAPRINAAGRIENASTAAELFLSEDRNETVRLASRLCEINRQRQELENLMTEEAFRKISEDPKLQSAPVILLDGERWHHGVIGIVASRITEKTGKPSILVSFEGSGNTGAGSDIGKGSGRSVEGFDLVGALIYCEDTLVKYGGHKLAAGLTVKREDLPALREKLCGFAESHLDTESKAPKVTAELELEAEDVSMALCEELELFEPFGVANPVPVFLMRGATLKTVTPIGQGKHLRITLEKSGITLSAVFFRMTLQALDIFPGDKVDVTFNLAVNEFSGRRMVQLTLRDMALSKEAFEREISERERFSSILEGNFDPSDLTDAEKRSTVPDRADFAALYNLLRRQIRMGHEEFTVRAVMDLLKEEGHPCGYVKVKTMILVFRELDLLGADEWDEERECYRFKYVFTKDKTDLERSGILKKVKSSVFSERWSAPHTTQ